MRQIKFRVWDKIEKEFLKSNDGLNFSPENKDSLPVSDCFEYNSFIVQQFTGFLDKNGVEVYEGDIIGGESESVYLMSGQKTGEKKHVKHEIIWDDKTGAWGKREIGKDSIWGGIKISLDYYPIIGHINQ